MSLESFLDQQEGFPTLKENVPHSCHGFLQNETMDFLKLFLVCTFFASIIFKPSSQREVDIAGHAEGKV